MLAVDDVTSVYFTKKGTSDVKIVDVKVAESSLLLSYRSKFYEMIAQADNEIDWFLEDLTDITFTMEENLKQKVIWSYMEQELIFCLMSVIDGVKLNQIVCLRLLKKVILTKLNLILLV